MGPYRFKPGLECRLQERYCPN
ncbi:hypothetical protein LINPERPRIM_LOCUS14864 [Linum perenne]